MEAFIENLRIKIVCSWDVSSVSLLIDVNAGWYHLYYGMHQWAVEVVIKEEETMIYEEELTRDSIECEDKKRLWLMIANNAAEEGLSDGKM